MNVHVIGLLFNVIDTVTVQQSNILATLLGSKNIIPIAPKRTFGQFSHSEVTKKIRGANGTKKSS